MRSQLARCLDDLEARLDTAEEARLRGEWDAFAQGRLKCDIFAPRRSKPNPPRVEWPRIAVNQALNDFDAMALQQFGLCSQALAKGDGSALAVRCNYGTSILPLLFGVELFAMDDEADTLPTSVPFHDADRIRQCVEAGPPSLQAGFGARVFEMGERFVEIASLYPKIGQCVSIYHPDTQGPFDVLEVVWGSEMFLALFDQGELVHAMLDRIAETYVEFMRRWERIAPFGHPSNPHWRLRHGGRIMLRDDSAMNLSPVMFDEFIRPYDQRLLDEFGGGAIHFCGKGDHYIERMTAMRGLRAIHMSQPHLNDMETIFANTVDRGINLFANGKAIDDARTRGRDFRGLLCRIV
ncbi:MAG: hypothetical protein BWZ10_00838 [candidate division BRC1 bacterium ADurb.BinA364]|nr:MAG: hypothetical protein BWZ10_00838 [candidate division BRC1 bacterium ADurb.BinA364]